MEPSLIHEDVTMPDERRILVVVLYHHPLFGEGLARMLAAEPGLEVVPVRTVDIATAERSLEPSPDVVIFERGDPDRAVDLLRFAPDALVIDVSMDPGPTFTYHREQIPARPEGLLRAIRGIRHLGRDAVTSTVAVAGVAAIGAMGLLGGS
jgi:DNA-binding NarL/FixJ family response regulator